MCLSKNLNYLHWPWRFVRRRHGLEKFHTLGYWAVYPWLWNYQYISNFVTIESFLLPTICKKYVIFLGNSVWMIERFKKRGQGVWNYPSDWIAVKAIYSHKLQLCNYPTLTVHWKIGNIDKNHSLPFEFTFCASKEVWKNV